MKPIANTEFNFTGQTSRKSGKVRDIYIINNDLLVSITTDRISAFDYILNCLIPLKGQVLNGLSAFFFNKTKDIVPNWLLSSPHPNVSIGLYCKPYPIEVIVRRYLSGSLWRKYQNGLRTIGDLTLADNLYENFKLDKAVITPSIKNENGHDIDINEVELINSKLANETEWQQIKKYALDLFAFGENLAAKKGIILSDTKYEFGNRDGQIYLIDEIHTPDSSRYFYSDSLNNNASDNSLYILSKEYLRKWLVKNNYSDSSTKLSELVLPNNLISEISSNYIKLYESITDKAIVIEEASNYNSTIKIKDAVENFLNTC